MSTSRQRINSAGSSRAASAGHESRMMRDTVGRLQQELMQSKAETQRISEQLSCMMLLVKKAWQGDQKAAINVANIVGVAPPDFEETATNGFSVMTTTPKDPTNPMSVVMKNKSRAVNNWAVLSIGLLNRSYKAAEERQEARQQYYMHQRQAYLDEQLLYHKHVQAQVQADMSREAEIARYDKQRQVQQSMATNHANVYEMISRNTQLQQQQQKAQLQQNSQPQPHVESLLKRSNSYSEGSNRRVKSASHAEGRGRGGGGGVGGTSQNTFLTQHHSRPHSGKPAVTVQRHLYKPASQNQQSNLKWTDLMIDPSHNKHHQTTATMNEPERSTYKLSSTQGDARQGRPPFQRRVSYDDPARYNVDGLFDAENALGPGSSAFRTRPVSAKAQHESDAARARPKSAVLRQGERSLKYEVVRPVSATTANNRASSAKSSNNRTSTANQRRPPSGKRNQLKYTPEERKHQNTPMHNNYTPINSSQNGNEHINGHHIHDGDEDFDGGESGRADDQNFDQSDESFEDEAERLTNDQAVFDKLGINLKELDAASRVPVMKINIKKPQSVIDFEHDVDEMHSMEKEIRKNALALQKKLGISAKGMI